MFDSLIFRMETMDRQLLLTLVAQAEASLAEAQKSLAYIESLSSEARARVTVIEEQLVLLRKALQG